MKDIAMDIKWYIIVLAIVIHLMINHAEILFFYFFKDLFLLSFHLKGGYTERRQRGRSSIRCFTPQVSATVDAMPIRSQEPLLGLPRGCRVPKLWALGRPRLLSQATVRELEGKQAAGIRTDAHMGSRACKART